MGRKTPEEKAVEYLINGKIKLQSLTDDSARALAYGSGAQPYTVTFDQAGWVCTCPAQSKCSHIIATELVTDLMAFQSTRLGHPDDELTTFLASFEKGEIFEEFWDAEDEQD